MSDIKKRNWAFVVYPESLPEDWTLKLRLKGTACAVSPLHDRDINPTGEAKKPHYHIILSFGNPTTYKNVLNFSQDFNGTIPIPLESVVGYYRYLTHKDNPEKAQYSEDDICLFNGFDPVELMTDSEVTNLLKQIVNIIIDNNIIEFEDLVLYLLRNDLHDLFISVEKHPYFIHLLLNSKRYKLKDLTTSHNYSNVSLERRDIKDESNI